MPIPWLAIAALGSAAASAYGASQQPDAYTQTTQPLPPYMNPQQQGLQNLLYYGAMTNLYPQQAGYQDLLSQYIYGGGPGAQTAQPATGTTAEQIISGYQQQKAGAAETETQLKGLETDIRTKTMQPFFEYLKQRNEMGGEERAKTYNELDTKAKETIQQLKDVGGMGQEEASVLVQAAEQKMFNQFQKENPDEFQKEAQTSLSVNKSIVRIPTFSYDYGDEAKLKEITGGKGVIAYTDEFVKSEDFGRMYESALGEKPLETPSAPAIPQAPLTPGMQGGILGQIMDPSYISEQFGLAKEKGMEEIGDWYSQAARELEQRGIAQHGGLMGSQYERDVGGLLSRRGEMESTLGRELRTAQIGAERQNWYDVLGALSGLQSLQSNLQTARTQPWMGAAQSLSTAPYGQTTTTPYQGVGMIPAAIGGAYAGAGLAQSLSNWGNRSQPATAAGAGMAGMTNIPGTYGASPSGYEGSMWGYGY